MPRPRTDVIRHFDLDRPAVIGHSLGGMLAALWAEEHPECPLAVNLDGHTNPTGPVLRGFVDEQVRRGATGTRPSPRGAPRECRDR
ncbi:alpha/beta fold hydrolase [Amycolatopsis sp. NPDC059090]|uniref:alpha/beta fold hydrolase n=1 Tax=Amycolatopsis sp. NPDC059090 TaxID=3346723 RepID=UPI00366D10C7